MLYICSVLFPVFDVDNYNYYAICNRIMCAWFVAFVKSKFIWADCWSPAGWLSCVFPSSVSVYCAVYELC